jgi:hypothetical protein
MASLKLTEKGVAGSWGARTGSVTPAAERRGAAMPVFITVGSAAPDVKVVWSCETKLATVKAGRSMSDIEGELIPKSLDLT